MKLLLVLGSDETVNSINQNIKPLGFELIRYQQVLKAMDNIDEIDPSAIIISATDFPRHWKVMVQFIRSERVKEVCPIILLKGERFQLEEASKAFYIGVTGIVSEELEDPKELERLQSLLSRYLQIEDKRKSRRFHVEERNRFGFCMVHPDTKSLLTGTVKTISSTGVSFHPDNSKAIEAIPEGQEISECSLRVGSDIIDPICRMIRRGAETSLEFIFLSHLEQIILDDYLETLPMQEIKSKNS
ncbi:hypothetical protein FACS1894151_03230 [Spirochaetia bacterium]|nr:hypothetical protein FACS1894151_03230 [Spirochaetia bacterium]